jgi:hypothetical protein
MRRMLIILLALLAVGAAVPVIAFGVVPIFVRSTVVEPKPPPVEQIHAPDAQAQPVPVALSGMLRRIDPVHYGSGSVTLSSAQAGRVLRFENVDIAGAPNMYVYLSDRSDGRPGRYTDLGPLKATNGSFNYSVPDSVDVSGVRSVVVWCRAFSVTVTYAPLAGA